MACFHTGSREGDLEMSSRNANRALTETTGLLCALMARLLETAGPTTSVCAVINTVPGLWAWWADHKDMDAARREQERQLAETKTTRQQALAKLSPAERTALGLL